MLYSGSAGAGFLAYKQCRPQVRHQGLFLLPWYRYCMCTNSICLRFAITYEYMLLRLFCSIVMELNDDQKKIQIVNIGRYSTMDRFCRDLQESCLYLESDGSVRIAEFSLGRRVRELVALANSVRLADPYPPSLGRGGKKSDIFRLGLVLASLATGKRVQEQQPLLHSLLASSGVGRLHLPPASLEDFLGRCLWREERDRWTASQLLEHPFLRENLVRPIPLNQEQQQQRQGEENRRSPSPVLGW